ncbi:MAG: molybdate ABC transporter permease subunit [Spirochaetes bacterium]|nr:molybdate ABC transporter permease subunit [Spirochaetota bacterium]
MNGVWIEAVWLTIRVAALSTMCTLPAAVFLGWRLARSSCRLKPVAEAFISFPLVAPPVVTGYLLLILLGRNSAIGKIASDLFGVSFTFNFTALVTASIVVSFPLAVRSIRSAFELVDKSYEKVSLTLGASRIDTFFRVSMPMALPGIVSGMVLAFARSLGEFGATITLAGNVPGKTQTMSLLIYSDMQVPGREKEVVILILISLSISFAAIVLSEIANRKTRYLKK